MPNFIEIRGVTRKPLVDLTRNDPSIRLLSSFFIKYCIPPPSFSLSFCPSASLSFGGTPHPIFLISGLSPLVGDVDVFFLQSKVYTFTIQTVLASSDHYCIETDTSSGEHRFTETVPPSSDHYCTKKLVPPDCSG